MGAVRPASRMRPVELVDDDEDAGPASPSSRAHHHGDDGTGGPGPDGTDREPADTGDGRRWWPWLVGVLVVAVVAGAIATSVAERAARERADLLGALPGVVRPLEAVPTTLWRVRADGPTPVLAAGGAIVTVSGAGGRWVVRSSAAATGEVRWEVPVVEPAGAGFESVAVACSAGADPDAVLLCAWTEPNVVYGSAGESTPYVPPMRFLALDPADGAPRGSWEHDGTVLGVVRHADDVVVATGLEDRRVRVERRDGIDGTVQWSWTSTAALVDNGGVRAAPSLVGDGDVVALVAISTAVLDARTGAVLIDGPPGRVILVSGLPDGGFATWASALGGHLRDADGTERAPVHALPVDVVGDGSLDEILLDWGNKVLATQPADGATVWSTSTSMSPVAVVDRTVVMAGEASVGAVDGADGRILWEQELTVELRSHPLTDGVHVLVPEPLGSLGQVLVARGLRDGVEAWRIALPPDLVEVRAVAGRVVALTPTDVVVLG
ncbi:PQQ-binding-like beta-propeller repeat protein [Cellulomonas sp. S1-8]|uniref:outer membrane protein assembly factor BamB family protein n=1 Tax=Cellulomonas sp. S1-8 TaxID=2904790 RepID=UPI002244612C|nr:PQQ-binding-like beta-propeller repeat protein [Cellulomonas sp. S1-8]UZN01781.1 PQQ-binding-like beta-propeller repeat protein [Cellulomonas sp. S1-8]